MLMADNQDYGFLKYPEYNSPGIYAEPSAYPGPHSAFDDHQSIGGNVVQVMECSVNVPKMGRASVMMLPRSRQ